VCEVEIECLEGDAALVFEVALHLIDAVALRPSPVTKAQRGYRVWAGKALRPLRAQPARVSCEMRPAEAAAAIVSAGLAQLQGNEQGLLETTEAEFVHQARVALRRMRAALRMFAKPIGAERAALWREELAQAAKTLGDARDWDVFAIDTLPALLRAHEGRGRHVAITRRAAARQAQARVSACEAVRSARYGRAIVEISQWLANPRADSEHGALEEFAANLLAKRHKRLAAGLDGLANADMAERHRVRIAAKRLRYVVEGLAPALDAVAARRYAQRLARLQEALGRANDAVAAQRLLEELEPPASLAASAKKWLHGRIDSETAALDRLASYITRSRPFWRPA
jgi:CHAD domain-containing protein